MVQSYITYMLSSVLLRVCSTTKSANQQQQMSDIFSGIVWCCDDNHLITNSDVARVTCSTDKGSHVTKIYI